MDYLDVEVDKIDAEMGHATVEICNVGGANGSYVSADETTCVFLDRDSLRNLAQAATDAADLLDRLHMDRKPKRKRKASKRK